ncbi:MAG: GTPase Era [Deltaproteobacteria bacterium]|nr:GTPase Era [Deltaproteobacteria bacterium]
MTTEVTDEGKGTETRAGMVAIVGRPNVGKSTLLNALLENKLAIVSPRPQTTRNRILGVRTFERDQLVLLDTPGIHRGKADLNRFMIKEALGSLQGVDGILLVTEVEPRSAKAAAEGGALQLHEEDRFVLEQVKQHKDASAPLLLAINKIDLLADRRTVLPLMQAWCEAGFERIVPISALAADGVDRVIAELRALLPVGPHLYPEDMFTDRAERFLVGELIREQVFTRCHQEIPYAVAVEVERFEERPDRGDVCIDALIHVERPGQKAIVIGAGGTMIRDIGTAARDEIGRLLGCPAHLRLTVHVEAEWSRRPGPRRRFGYE